MMRPQRHIARRAAIALFLLLVQFSPAAHAAACKSREAYSGPVLHPPLIIDKLEQTPDAELPEAKRKQLERTLASIRGRIDAPALSVAVHIPGQGMWRHDDAPAQTPRLFWASAGKTMTAVVILQLVRERKLSLDQTVGNLIDGVPNGRLVTIRDLLAHTAGLYSSNEDPKVRATPRYRDSKENLRIARQHGPLFCPGAKWRYSNTGYNVLGEIVRKVDGRRIDVAITDRIIRPLQLRSMIALAPGGGAAGVAPLTSATGKTIDPSWPGAAGPIASDAADMARFWNALLAGQVLPIETVNEMFGTLYPMFDSGSYYGLGAMMFDVPDGDERLLWVGHGGGTPGASAIVAWSPRDKALVAAVLTGDGNAVPVANALLKAMRCEFG